MLVSLFPGSMSAHSSFWKTKDTSWFSWFYASIARRALIGCHNISNRCTKSQFIGFQFKFLSLYNNVKIYFLITISQLQILSQYHNVTILILVTISQCHNIIITSVKTVPIHQLPIQILVILWHCEIISSQRTKPQFIQSKFLSSYYCASNCQLVLFGFILELFIFQLLGRFKSGSKAAVNCIGKWIQARQVTSAVDTV